MVGFVAVAVGRDDTVLGWSAAEPIYQGNVWELNVLVVRPAGPRQGIGSALLADLMVPDLVRLGFTSEILLPNQGFPARFLGSHD
jgi:GNAT superfamily N-acetyltransferase